jgi:hypothetical protein
MMQDWKCNLLQYTQVCSEIMRTYWSWCLFQIQSYSETNVLLQIQIKVKGKAIPVIGRGGP